MSLFGLGHEKIALFALAVFVLAVTPGPVWIYLISRTLVQGRRAGFFSILGVQLGVAVHVLAAAAGLSAIALAIPVAYDAIKLAGAAYLLWLGISTLRGGGMSFEAQALPPAPDRTLLRQGFAASLLNPKVALFYLSLFPQFVDVGGGAVFAQSTVLGVVHILVSMLVDGALVAVAGALAVWLAARPLWMRAQRWVLGSAFGALAVWLALTPRQANAG